MLEGRLALFVVNGNFLSALDERETFVAIVSSTVEIILISLSIGRFGVNDVYGVVNRRGSLTAFVRFTTFETVAVVGVATVKALLECTTVDKVKLNRGVFGKTDWIDDAGKGLFMRTIANPGKVEVVVAFIRCAEDGACADLVVTISSA